MIFDKQWFKKYQSKLLWLANTPLIKIWFRWILRIHKDIPADNIIYRIMPNNITFGLSVDKLEKEKINLKTDFRTHEKFGKRLYYAFRYIWMICHAWDIIVNWLRLPVLDLGFAELTFYPDAGDPAATAADAHFDKDAGSWAGARDAASADAVSQVNATMQILSDDRGGGNYSIGRGITLFPTSSIPDGATIISAVLSLFENLGFSISDTDTTSLEITETSPASNTHLITSDYGTYTFVSLASINFSAITISDYNAFTLNDLSVVNKTGITKLGQITGRDLSDTAPTGNNRIYFYQSDETGTSRDPKLVVNFTVKRKSFLTLLGVG